LGVTQPSTRKLTSSFIVRSTTAVAFEVFDFNGDGFIDRDELLTILQLTNRRGMTLNQLEQIADSTMERWDVQRRGKLIYPEFKALLGASTAVLSL
jgi:Ca2+-binding EF-hand superfamily protein